ncbi:MAG: fumarylacetoacetate hydrolase family protein [Saprospiraceae bacterium]|nr:fumarylacetoacetate hydrolase family protein [Saprospiraceae bacterium]
MNIFCIGRNYMDHAKELNNPIPKEPVVFMKPGTAVLHNNKPFYYPNFTKDLHHEIELVFKIHKKGKAIQENQALSFISHVTIGIDFTARDIQQRCKEKGLPWEIAKAFDHSAVIGSWIPIEDVDLNLLQFTLLKNDEIVQEGNSKDMIFKLPNLIAYLSSYFTLNKGDLIFTGTPAGVSAVKIGDRLIGLLDGTPLFQFNIK